MNNKNMTLSHLVDALHNSSRITQENAQKILQSAEQFDDTRKLPRIVQFAAGLGALLSAMFVLGFVFGFLRRQLAVSNSYWWEWGIGIVLMLVAFQLYERSHDHEPDARNTFLRQLSISLMFSGKLLVGLGALRFLESINPFPYVPFYRSALLSMVAASLTAITYRTYPVAFDRFLSALATFLLLFLLVIPENGILISDHGRTLSRGAFIFQRVLEVMYVIGLLGLSYILLSPNPAARAYRPLAYAGLILLPLYGTDTIHLPSIPNVDTLWKYELRRFVYRLIEIIFTVYAVGLIAYIARTRQQLKSEPVQLALAAMTILALSTNVGVTLAVAMIVLGHHARDTWIKVYGFILLPLFIYLYYHNLNITLLEKSGLLIFNGLVLLAGWHYTRYRKLDEGA